MELNTLYERNPEWADGGVLTVLCDDVPFTSSLPVDTGDYRGALSYQYAAGRYRLALRRDRQLWGSVRFVTGFGSVARQRNRSLHSTGAGWVVSFFPFSVGRTFALEIIVHEKEEKMKQETPEAYLKLFGYAHLPAHLQAISKPFHDLATQVVETLPSNFERLYALRNLLLAKDAAVRSFLIGA